MCYISEWKDLKPERQLGAQGAGLYDFMAATKGLQGEGHGQVRFLEHLSGSVGPVWERRREDKLAEVLTKGTDSREIQKVELIGLIMRNSKSFWHRKLKEKEAD